MKRHLATDSERLRDELDDVRTRLLAIVEESAICNVDPNRHGGGVYFVGAATWGWGPADGALTVARMDLLDQYQRWYERFRLLFRTPTPEVKKKLEGTDKFVRRWLERPGNDHSIPSSIEAASGRSPRIACWPLTNSYPSWRSAETADPASFPTPTLIDNPDLASYAAAVGVDHAVVHLLPSVLSELDDLKASAHARTARGRAFGCPTHQGPPGPGRLTCGVTVAGKVTARAETVEVDPSEVLGWLDPTVTDDRIIAAALRLQSDYLADSVILITSDLNLQNKAEAAGLPYVEPYG